MTSITSIARSTKYFEINDKELASVVKCDGDLHNSVLIVKEVIEALVE